MASFAHPSSYMPSKHFLCVRLFVSDHYSEASFVFLHQFVCEDSCFYFHGQTWSSARRFPPTTESVDETLKCGNFLPETLSTILYKVVRTLDSANKILQYDHSNESYWAVLSSGAVYYAVQGGSNFWVCGWNSKVGPFKWKLLSSTFLWCCLLCCTRWF